MHVDVDDLGVDLLSIDGNKCYAPNGMGALYIRRSTLIDPVVVGAGRAHGIRPGTENVASAVGRDAACAPAAANMLVEAEPICEHRDPRGRYCQRS